MVTPEYFIMDGRARYDTDKAIVIECCDSLKEAMEAMKRYYKGYDYVVVQRDTNAIIYDPQIHGR